MTSKYEALYFDFKKRSFNSFEFLSAAEPSIQSSFSPHPVPAFMTKAEPNDGS